MSVLKEFNPNAIVISGSPGSVDDPASPQIDPGVFDMGIPLLGICYGLQLMNHVMGGSVAKGWEKCLFQSLLNFYSN